MLDGKAIYLQTLTLIRLYIFFYHNVVWCMPLNQNKKWTTVCVLPSSCRILSDSSSFILVFSIFRINFDTPTTHTWTCLSLHLSTGEPFLDVISPWFDCQSSMGRGSAHQPAWNVVACFLNVLLIQEAERHGGWLAVASHSWYCLWVLRLPKVTEINHNIFKPKLMQNVEKMTNKQH